MFFVIFFDSHTLREEYYGILMCLFGCLLIFNGVAGFTLLSFPFFIISVIFYKMRKVSTFFSLLSVIFAFAFIFFDEIKGINYCPGDLMFVSCPAYIYKLGYGYFLWLLSTALLFFSNFLRIPKKILSKFKHEMKEVLKNLFRFFKNAYQPIENDNIIK